MARTAEDKLIPLSKAIRASIIDVYGDIGRVQEMHTHWAARVFKQLNRQSLKIGKRRVLLPVNGNTHTATLPIDFEEETFVGRLDDYGKKVPLRVNTKLVTDSIIPKETCEDKCEKCQQDKSICNELQITETIELITINETVYEKTVIKKLYPNGDYYLETNTPMLDLENNQIVYFPQKELITNMDLKSCGCLDTNPENLATLQRCCPEVYCCYYAECAPCCVDDGSYIIQEDVGLIQLNPLYRYKFIYIEYWGFMPKRNGQYLIPEVSFESVVSGTKFKSVENKSNVPLTERNWYWQRYLVATGNMNKELGRVTLSSIIMAAERIPKFDIYIEPWDRCFRTPLEVTAASNNACDTNASDITPSGSTVVYLYRDIAYGRREFKVGEPGSPMVAGQTTLIINDPKIFNNSVNVFLDGTIVYENMPGAIYCVLAYSSTGVSVTIYDLDIDNPTINHGVSDGQKYKITYTKTV